uniref:Neur_chan_LBD domain-containing protein n=1 Tax=Macrostomum lignano TaxID=282301 RepID=A0A1I8HXS1_9PLAT
MFRRKDRGGSRGSDGSGGDSGPLSRSWPWHSLNASEMENRSFEYQIKATIMDSYQKVSRPVLNDSEPVVVFVGFSLFHILDTTQNANFQFQQDEKYQTMKSLISVRLRWTDSYLQWDPEEFGNTSKIWISASNLWLPDILISNYADDDYSEHINTNAIVSSDGTVLWMYPMVTKTYCEFDIELFPFDSQICNVSFFSWTFGSRMLDLHIDESVTNNNFYNPEGQEWFVEKITHLREVKIFVCCKDDQFPNVHYRIHMRRRSLFYIMNLIFPCLLIYCCSFLGFFLPVESGEKVNLEITILLALVVFLIIAGEVLPPTPDVVPILGLLYGTSMLMVSVALIMAVIVTNLYSNAARLDRPVPKRLLKACRVILFSWSVHCVRGGDRGDGGVDVSSPPADEEEASPVLSGYRPTTNIAVSPLQRSLPASARNLKHMATHGDVKAADDTDNCWHSSRAGSPVQQYQRDEAIRERYPVNRRQDASGRVNKCRQRTLHRTLCFCSLEYGEITAAREESLGREGSPADRDDLIRTPLAQPHAPRGGYREGVSKDWQLVSLAADRLFFWLFVVASALLQAFIFWDVSFVE